MIFSASLKRDKHQELCPAEVGESGDTFLVLLQSINRYTTVAQLDNFLKLLHGPLSHSSEELTDRDVHRLHVFASSRRSELTAPRPWTKMYRSGFPERPKSIYNRKEAATGSREPQRWARKQRLGGLSALPPAPSTSGFTEGERATLYIVAADVREGGSCRCTVAEIADRAGVGATTVRNAIRKARLKGLISVTHRPQGRSKWLSNVITIICSLWLNWLKRFRPNLGIRAIFKGVKKALTIDTHGNKKERFATKPDCTAFRRRQFAFERSGVLSHEDSYPV